MTADPLALEAGTELSEGRYEIERVLGQGGFGITYLANDHNLDRNVAIKEFFMAGSSRAGTTVRVPEPMKPQVEERMDRIRDEAKVLGRFRHPGIVTVHEYFEENESIYVVMELLDGTSLRQVIERAGGPLPEREVVGYGRDIASSLAAVHAQHLLHRDVKPDNVMIMHDGQVVLVDFGTAREFALDESSLMSQTLSPAYAPVEQYSARGRFGPSTDIYALGATMYHMATGVFPTPSLDRFTGDDLRAPGDLNPEISPHLSQAIMWAMNVEADDRPQSADAFLAVLEGADLPKGHDPAATRTVNPATAPPAVGSQAVAGSSGTATPPPSAASSPPTVTPRAAPVRRKKRSKVKRSARRAGRTLVNIIITLAIAIAATALVAWWLNRDADEGGQPADPPVELVAQSGD